MIRKLERKFFFGLLLAMFLTGMLTTAFNIQPLNATSSRVHYIDTDEKFAAIDEMVLEWEWTQNYDTVDEDFPVSVAVDSNNYIIAAGFNKDPAVAGDNDSAWRIVKLDKDGNEISQWSYFYNPTAGMDMINSVAVDHLDNIIAVGCSTPPGESAYWRIIKLDKDKNLLWEKTFDFPPVSGDDYDDRAYDVAVDTNNNIIAVGYDYQDGGNNARWRVIKLEPTNGDVVWSKPFDPNPSRSESAHGVAVDHNNNIIVVGSDQNGTTNDDWGIKKLDPNGNIITGCDLRIEFSSNYESPQDVAVDSQDNFIVVGYDETKGPQDSQWRIVKFDPNCNEIWRGSYDWSSRHDRAMEVAVDAYDSIIVVGYDREGDDYKWRIIKFNGQTNTPEILSQESVNPLVDVDSFEKAHGVAVIEGTDVVVVGSDDSPTPDVHDRQWRIMKFAYTYARETQNLIETIRTWNLPKGTENSLTSKLDGAIHLLSEGNEKGAVHKLGAFIKHVEAVSSKKLRGEQASHLIAEARRIIDLIKD